MLRNDAIQAEPAPAEWRIKRIVSLADVKQEIAVKVSNFSVSKGMSDKMRINENSFRVNNRFFRSLKAWAANEREI